jgi:hypothetical protein
MVIFNSYVKLPEGNPSIASPCAAQADFCLRGSSDGDHLHGVPSIFPGTIHGITAVKLDGRQGSPLDLVE